MVELGKVRSTVRPETRVIDENSVWAADNIEAVQVTDESGEHTEYAYDLTQYSKDEYIAKLEGQVTDTQLALCDVYEMLAAE